MPNLRFTISIPSKDLELSRFMEDKLNRNGMSLSAYIRDLIRKDMENQTVSSGLEEIYTYVLKRITEEGYVMKEQGTVKINHFIDEVDKDIILDLF